MYGIMIQQLCVQMFGLCGRSQLTPPTTTSTFPITPVAVEPQVPEEEKSADVVGRLDGGDAPR